MQFATSCCCVKKQRRNCYGSCNSFETNEGCQCNSPVTYNGRVNTVARKEMCYFCFDILRNHLGLGDGATVKAPVTFPNDSHPLFVTWKIGRDRRLRGCIGTFTSTALHSALREYAVSSAALDSRFAPVAKEEIARLHCSVSILTDFEEARNYRDWTLGQHGIRIEFCNERGVKRSATYLPEVPLEQNWTQLDTVDSLLRKGGYKAAITEHTRASAKVVRYRSEKITVSFTEYMHFKQNGCRV